MAKIDEAKELIGFLKVIFVTLFVIDTSLIAWVFNNHSTSDSFELFIVDAIIVVISIIVAFLFLKILKEIKRLKDL